MEWLPLIGAILAGLWSFVVVMANRNADEPVEVTSWAVPGVIPAGPRQEASDKPKRPAISAALRAELDQTPEWWDTRFHSLLAQTKQPYLEYGEVEYIEEHTFGGQHIYHVLDRPIAYLTCTCARCRHNRTLGVDPRD